MKCAYVKGSLVQRELDAKRTEGLFLLKLLLFYNPSGIFLRKCHLPLHKGGVKLVRLVLLLTVIAKIYFVGNIE